MSRRLFELVVTEPRAIGRYAAVVGSDLVSEIQDLAGKLHGKRLLYVNSNQNKGGVHEHLSSLVPLIRGLGCDVTWMAASRVPSRFYEVTRKLYSALQGDRVSLSSDDWKIYEATNRRAVAEIGEQQWDFVLVQDHQFAGVARLAGQASAGRKWIWQSHSDTSAPDPAVVRAFAAHLRAFDAHIYYFPSYRLAVGRGPRTIFSTIAIDPLSEKNRPMSRATAWRAVAAHGFDQRRPLVTQVSRFDVWKDFPGVLAAWRDARARVPGLQLALIGSIATPTHRTEQLVDDLRREVSAEPDAQVLVNRIAGREIKAFQVASTVVVQKSLREGFGLTVSEALWAKTPVIGGDVGGISAQIADGVCGYLVRSVEECAERIVDAASDPARARAMGAAGHDRVRTRFLLPRLIRDELRLMTQLRAA